jgi:hypothetical protein
MMDGSYDNLYNLKDIECWNEGLYGGEIFYNNISFTYSSIFDTLFEIYYEYRNEGTWIPKPCYNENGDEIEDDLQDFDNWMKSNQYVYLYDLLDTLYYELSDEDLTQQIIIAQAKYNNNFIMALGMDFTQKNPRYIMKKYDEESKADHNFTPIEFWKFEYEMDVDDAIKESNEYILDYLGPLNSISPREMMYIISHIANRNDCILDRGFEMMANSTPANIFLQKLYNAKMNNNQTLDNI